MTSLDEDVYVLDEAPSEIIDALVGAGAAWLDETWPDWEASVNLSTLNLSLSEFCICGQVFNPVAEMLTEMRKASEEGLYWHEAINGWEVLTFIHADLDAAERTRWAVNHGFMAGFIPRSPGDEWQITFEALDAGWIRELKARANA